jgi:thiol-disulfide isomerase/thioredoxin
VTFLLRLRLLPLLVPALALFGCDETTTTTATGITETPPNVLSPAAPDEAKAEPPKPASTAPSGESPKAEKTEATTADAAPSTGKVELVSVKYDELRKKIATNGKAKLTLVDAWATWCPTCMENFPHVVQMHKKYGDQGLNVISLSLDDPTEPKALAAATKFLEKEHAVFSNYLLNEEPEVAFEKLNVSGIPAVFLYGPEGHEIKRFTLDDPNNQFTYDQVEQAVVALLKGEAIASDAPKK